MNTFDRIVAQYTTDMGLKEMAAFVAAVKRCLIHGWADAQGEPDQRCAAEILADSGK